MNNHYRGNKMDNPNIETCCGKDCDDIPKWYHQGMDIALCDICLEKSGINKNFVKISW